MPLISLFRIWCLCIFFKIVNILHLLRWKSCVYGYFFGHFFFFFTVDGCKRGLLGRPPTSPHLYLWTHALPLCLDNSAPPIPGDCFKIHWPVERPERRKKAWEKARLNGRFEVLTMETSTACHYSDQCNKWDEMVLRADRHDCEFRQSNLGLKIIMKLQDWLGTTIRADRNERNS